MEKKIAKKYADLIIQANNSTGRKEALSLIKQATKLKTKLDQYEMMQFLNIDRRFKMRYKLAPFFYLAIQILGDDLTSSVSIKYCGIN